VFSIATQMVVGISGMSFKYKEISYILFIDLITSGVKLLSWFVIGQCSVNPAVMTKIKRYLCSSILKHKWMISFLLLLHFILLISSPFNKFATKSKSVIILVFPQQADPAHLKLMDQKLVATFSLISVTIS
jgi:hypothetical protein